MEVLNGNQEVRLLDYRSALGVVSNYVVDQGQTYYDAAVKDRLSLISMRFCDVKDEMHSILPDAKDEEVYNLFCEARSKLTDTLTTYFMNYIEVESPDLPHNMYVRTITDDVPTTFIWFPYVISSEVLVAQDTPPVADGKKRKSKPMTLAKKIISAKLETSQFKKFIINNDDEVIMMDGLVHIKSTKTK